MPSHQPSSPLGDVPGVEQGPGRRSVWAGRQLTAVGGYPKVHTVRTWGGGGSGSLRRRNDRAPQDPPPEMSQTWGRDGGGWGGGDCGDDRGALQRGGGAQPSDRDPPCAYMCTPPGQWRMGCVAPPPPAPRRWSTGAPTALGGAVPGDVLRIWRGVRPGEAGEGSWVRGPGGGGAGRVFLKGGSEGGVGGGGLWGGDPPPRLSRP